MVVVVVMDNSKANQIQATKAKDGKEGERDLTRDAIDRVPHSLHHISPLTPTRHTASHLRATLKRSSDALCFALPRARSVAYCCGWLLHVCNGRGRVVSSCGGGSALSLLASMVAWLHVWVDGRVGMEWRRYRSLLDGCTARQLPFSAQSSDDGWRKKKRKRVRIVLTRDTKRGEEPTMTTMTTSTTPKTPSSGEENKVVPDSSIVVRRTK
ncbi:uncharacterized protein IWZ02DRAFT_50731 [Phyllosticta citriasiana]